MRIVLSFAYLNEVTAFEMLHQFLILQNLNVACDPNSIFASIFSVRMILEEGDLGSNDMCLKYDVFRRLTTFNNCRCVLARSNISSLGTYLAQEILRSVCNIHISKAFILLRDLNDQVFASYNSIDHMY